MMARAPQVEEMLRRMHATRDRVVRDASRFQEVHGATSRGTKGAPRGGRVARSAADRRRDGRQQP